MAEIDELTSRLKDNLDRMKQHSVRADTIVKNALHSRDCANERRPIETSMVCSRRL